MVTWQSHAEVDGPWLDLLRPAAGRAEYTAQIVRAYGFIAPFESACRYTPDLGRLLHLHQVSRASLLARDLLALGLTPAQVAVAPQCHSIATFRDVGEAFGWLYVVERATLLHDSLRSRLLAHIPEIANACSFLVANEGRGQEHWGAFGRTLEQVGARPEIANEIVAGARDAVVCLKQWFRGEPEPQRHTG